MSSSAAAVEQTGPGQQHRTGTDGADSANSSRNLSEPADYLRIDFVPFDRIATGDKQSVDVSAQFTECLICGHAQAAIRDERSTRRSGYHFDRIDRTPSGIFAGEHLRRASKDLKGTN
jgi:hypothetical protein